MNQLAIFIASSSEQQHLAEQVANSLSKLKQRPIRWWTSFDPSTYALEVLERELQNADAGIFLCSGDDVATLRGSAVAIPRDNVILELGMYLGVVGRKRCFIVADQMDRHLRLPTDLNGITTMSSRTDPDSIAAQVVDTISRALASQVDNKEDCLHIRADPSLAIKILATPTPEDWQQRALYCGTEGARAWLAYSKDEFRKVQTSKDRVVDRRETNRAVKDGDWRCFISLGPGDARRDRDIHPYLRRANGAIEYVPVDISEGLIHHAAQEMIAAGALVPFGILADFEAGQEFLFKQLNRAFQPGRLFALLGNTLGNLDVGAERFLEEICTRMQRDDELLLDIATTRAAWNFDPYAKYFVSPIRREFIAQGIAKQLGQVSHEILSQFEARIAANHVGGPSYADQYVIYDKQSGKIGLTLRVFYFEQFLNWIQSELPHFRLMYHEEFLFEGTKFGSGLIRLRKQ